MSNDDKLINSCNDKYNRLTGTLTKAYISNLRIDIDPFPF